MDLIERNRHRRNAALGIFFMLYLASSWLYPPAALLIPVCMMLGIALAFHSGKRLWCGKFCPRGNFLELFGRVLMSNAPTPGFMGKAGFRYGLLAALMTWMTARLFALWPDYSAIERFLAILLTITTGTAIVLAALFRPRAWCGICPIGTIASSVARRG